jgi:hypothetical protein
MTAVFNFFKYISNTFGSTAGIMFIIFALLLAFVIFLIKTFPDVIKVYIDNKAKEHYLGTERRKNASLEINKILSDVIIDHKLDRAVVFEFSNGNSNLAGLPFLFINATYEQLSLGTQSVCRDYQRFNVSLFADFIYDLENKSYFYCEHIDEIKNKYVVLYNMLKTHNVESVLFYSVYGMDKSIGFICVASVNGKTFQRDDLLPEVADMVQKINIQLHTDDEFENRQGK